MRKFLGVLVVFFLGYFSCSEIAVSQTAPATATATAAPQPALLGAALQVMTNATDANGQPVQINTSALPSWFGKGLLAAFGLQGLLLLLSTGLMKLGTATQNATETKIGTIMGQGAWALGAVLSHFGGQKPAAPAATTASSTTTPPAAL